MSFVERAREAIEAQGLNADTVRYFLLPPFAIGPEVLPKISTDCHLVFVGLGF